MTRTRADGSKYVVYRAEVIAPDGGYRSMGRMFDTYEEARAAIDAEARRVAIYKQMADDPTIETAPWVAPTMGGCG